MLIYKIENIINGKVYIGMTKSNTPNRRWSYHKRDRKRNKNIPLYKAMNKYGIENFNLIVLESEIENIEELIKKEIYYISLYESTNSSKGYNCTTGGEGVSGIIGEKNHRYGKKNIKLSEFNKSRKGIPLSESHKIAIKNGSKRLPHTQAAIEKMREKRKQAWIDGKYNSDDYRHKQSIIKIGKKRKSISATERLGF